MKDMKVLPMAAKADTLADALRLIEEVSNLKDGLVTSLYLRECLLMSKVNNNQLDPTVEQALVDIYARRSD